MGATDESSGKRGCRCLYLGTNILGNGTVSVGVWVGDMGDDPTHWEGVGRIPPQGGPQADGEAALAGEGQCVDINPAG